MIPDLTVSNTVDEPLPPPAWLVGGIVATVIFVAAALIAAVPNERRQAPAERVDPVLHAGGFASIANPRSFHTEPSAVSLPELSQSTPTLFDPINLSLPLL
jgi:hypothetical protein